LNSALGLCGKKRCWRSTGNRLKAVGKVFGDPLCIRLGQMPDGFYNRLNRQSPKIRGSNLLASLVGAVHVSGLKLLLDVSRGPSYREVHLVSEKAGRLFFPMVRTLCYTKNRLSHLVP